MKKIITLFITILLLSSCKKEKLPESNIDNSKNPILISITINDETTEIIRVR
jgi:hypothetical protein